MFCLGKVCPSELLFQQWGCKMGTSKISRPVSLAIESLSTQPSLFLQFNGFISCQKDMCLLESRNAFQKMWPPFSLSDDFSCAFPPKQHLFCAAVSSALFVCPEVFEVLHETIASRDARLCLLPGYPQQTGMAKGGHGEMFTLRSMDAGVEVYLPTTWLVMKGINIPETSRNQRNLSFRLSFETTKFHFNRWSIY